MHMCLFFEVQESGGSHHLQREDVGSHHFQREDVGSHRFQRHLQGCWVQFSHLLQSLLMGSPWWGMCIDERDK